jgi:hypothetical protein
MVHQALTITRPATQKNTGSEGKRAPRGKDSQECNHHRRTEQSRFSCPAKKKKKKKKRKPHLNYNPTNNIP